MIIHRTTSLLIFFFLLFSTLCISQSWEVNIGAGYGSDKNKFIPRENTFGGVQRINDTVGVEYITTRTHEYTAQYKSGNQIFVGLTRNFKPTENNYRLRAGAKVSYSTLKYRYVLTNFETVSYETFDTLAIFPPFPPVVGGTLCDTIIGLEFLDRYNRFLNYTNYQSIEAIVELGFGKGFADNKVWLNIGGSIHYSFWYETVVPSIHLIEDIIFTPEGDIEGCRYTGRTTSTQEFVNPINFMGNMSVQIFPNHRLGLEVGARKYVSNIFNEDRPFAARPTYAYLSANYKFGNKSIVNNE